MQPFIISEEDKLDDLMDINVPDTVLLLDVVKKH